MNAEQFNRDLKNLKDSEEAFSRIYAYYLPRLKVHLADRFGNAVDFEDVAHEVFTKLFAFENPPWVEYPTAWMFRIADNIALDEIKRSSRTVPLKEVAAPERERDGFFDIVGRLGEDKDVIILTEWEGYSLKEAARILGINYAAARQRRSRAFKKLKVILKDDKK